MKIEGTFELTMTAEPPYDDVDGVTLARVAFDKRFSGPLDATSKVNMIGARTPVQGSAGYVASRDQSCAGTSLHVPVSADGSISQAPFTGAHAAHNACESVVAH